MSAPPRERFAIALAQLNPTVGDIDGNLSQLRAARAQAASLGAELMIAGELALAGYPPEDLVLRPSFQRGMRAALEELAGDTADGGPALLVGVPLVEDGALYNCAALLDGGAVVTTRRKHDLPNYGVFDEKRVFAAGPLPGPIACRGVRLGVMVCEDMWTPDVAECLAESGAEILVVINGSPFEADKPLRREALAVERVVETGLPLIYVNQIGGQDELVFDGASFALDALRRPVLRLPGFVEDVALSVWQRGTSSTLIAEPGPIVAPIEGLEAIYRACVLGLGDYVRKNRFPGIVLGLSGGIDSALAAAIAVDALGADAVRGVMLPSPYTSTDSLEDAAAVASLLGIRLDTVRIEPAMAAFAEMLSPLFGDRPADITEENVQSRIRGVTLMALSNKLGPMVLSTGNKSEMSTGYATLYGDMCGGFAVLKDLYKTTIFQLCRWRNAYRPIGVLGPSGPVMPERVITKPPTAELKPDQTDQDTLPAYDILDAILERLIEGERSIAEIVADGFDRDLVERVRRMLDRAEYKRRQAPPGVKLTPRSFGRDRRYPITHRFNA